MKRPARKDLTTGRHLAMSGREGFTLIEVMVAFIVLALSTVVIQRAVMSSSAGIVRADQRIAAETVIRTLITGPLGTGQEAIRRRSGQMSGLAWAIRFEPVDMPFPTVATADPKTAAWAPIKMIVSVTRPGAKLPDMVVETVRLVKL